MLILGKILHSREKVFSGITTQIEVKFEGSKLTNAHINEYLLLQTFYIKNVICVSRGTFNELNRLTRYLIYSW